MATAIDQEVDTGFRDARTVPRCGAEHRWERTGCRRMEDQWRAGVRARRWPFRWLSRRRAARDRCAPPAMPCRDAMPDVLTDPDSLRELVHEIKTPLNAIIGFAEIIEGQYLGPADRGYRERAAEIVRQARLLLTAIDDLDFAAKIHSSAWSAARAGRPWRAGQPRAPTSSRDGGRSVASKSMSSGQRRSRRARRSPELADRLLFRLFNALVERAERGERLRLVGRTRRAMARGSRSAGLRRFAGAGDGELFEPRGRDGRGRRVLRLRLARGLARIAGGDLVGEPRSLRAGFPARLSFPALAAPRPCLSRRSRGGPVAQR